MIKSTTSSTPKVDSNELCEYILAKYGSMSHLKIQKLLFYVQAYHLAYFDAPLFDDEFQAWMHGPVSRKIYDLLKSHSILLNSISFVPDSPEHKPIENLEKKLIPEQVELINDVLDEMAKLSAYQLENLTHSEQPWIEARKGYAAGDRCERIIPKDRMRDFYKDLLYG